MWFRLIPLSRRVPTNRIEAPWFCESSPLSACSLSGAPPYLTGKTRRLTTPTMSTACTLIRRWVNWLFIMRVYHPCGREDGGEGAVACCMSGIMTRLTHAPSLPPPSACAQISLPCHFLVWRGGKIHPRSYFQGKPAEDPRPERLRRLDLEGGG